MTGKRMSKDKMKVVRLSKCPSVPASVKQYMRRSLQKSSPRMADLNRGEEMTMVVNGEHNGHDLMRSVRA
jgi:hypothetical protein